MPVAELKYVLNLDYWWMASIDVIQWAINKAIKVFISDHSLQSVTACLIYSCLSEWGLS